MADADQHRTDVQVWQDLREALQACLRADKEISERTDPAAVAAACEQFDRSVTQALLAYADLQLRGLLGLFEDILIDRGMTGDTDGAMA